MLVVAGGEVSVAQCPTLHPVYCRQLPVVGVQWALQLERGWPQILVDEGVRRQEPDAVTVSGQEDSPVFFDGGSWAASQAPLGW